LAFCLDGTSDDFVYRSHANIPQLIEAVKRGVQLNGGLAIDFPTISLHESFAAPTSMYLRNLMSMDTEEMIQAQPVDAVVLIGGTHGLCGVLSLFVLLFRTQGRS
jgi:dihydroxyacid dehydratase/phosphogluconate dehydratase